MTATTLPTPTLTASLTLTAPATTTAPVVIVATPTEGGKGLVAGGGDELPLWQIGLMALAAGLVVTVGGGRMGRWIQTRRLPPGPQPVVVVEAENGGGPVVAAEADDGKPELPGAFFGEGARILVVGPTRSGKSTVLHLLLKRALVDGSFGKILLFDGKGPELTMYAGLPEVEYYGPESLVDWPEVLGRISDGLPERYAALGGERIAPEDASRKLIVIDEVQRATRGEQGKEITKALLLIAEQSGALRDVVILTTQRATHRTLSKDIAYNASLIVQMVGATSPGRFGVKTSIEQRKAVAYGQGRPMDDNDIAAQVAEIGDWRLEIDSVG